MLKVTDEKLDKLDRDYPGARDYVLDLEATPLPSCEHCESDDTAKVNVGVTGRTIAILGATSKFKRIMSGPNPGAYFCNSCDPPRGGLSRSHS